MFILRRLPVVLYARGIKARKKGAVTIWLTGVWADCIDSSSVVRAGRANTMNVAKDQIHVGHPYNKNESSHSNIACFSLNALGFNIIERH